MKSMLDPLTHFIWALVLFATSAFLSETSKFNFDGTTVKIIGEGKGSVVYVSKHDDMQGE